MSAADAAIYTVSAGGLALLAAAGLFVWLSMRRPRDEASHRPPAE